MRTSVASRFYNDMLAPVADELDRLGLLREQRRRRMRVPAGLHRTRRRAACRSSSASATAGTATAPPTWRRSGYRTQDLGATRLLYVVGAPQHQHFEMVYAVARQAGWLGRAAHGRPRRRSAQVLGADGKKLAPGPVRRSSSPTCSTRPCAGPPIWRRQKNPDLDAKPPAEVARAVGIGAIKYVDLSSDRVKDYVFDWDRMLSFDGDTAAYLQYTYARIQSIFRRAGIEQFTATPITVGHPAEHALAIELINFGAVVTTVEQTLEFHRLAGYLHTLAATFSGFYEHCPVLRAEGEVRNSRLALCDLTARVLRHGLYLLGIASSGPHVAIPSTARTGASNHVRSPG